MAKKNKDSGGTLISERQIKNLDLIDKHRTRKETQAMAQNRMQQVSGEATKKQINQMLERSKAQEAEKRKKISNRTK